MTEQEIREGNRVLLKFMGYELKDYLWRKSPLKEPQYSVGKSVFDGDNTNSFEFHTNWNYLMKVVAKIESLDYFVTIGKHISSIKSTDKQECFTSVGNTKIVNTFKVCVEFVNNLD